MIEAHNLTKKFGDFVAVDDISLTVKKGEIFGLLGPNGAGKSTTMRMIMGLDAPDAGTVTINGRRYHDLGWPLREVGALLDQGKSKKKVMVVDEDAPTLRTLTEVLEARGYQVVESNGTELVSKAVSCKPDIIILNSLLSSDQGVRSLRFEKGLENVLFLIYQ